MLITKSAVWGWRQSPIRPSIFPSVYQLSAEFCPSVVQGAADRDIDTYPGLTDTAVCRWEAVQRHGGDRNENEEKEERALCFACSGLGYGLKQAASLLLCN